MLNFALICIVTKYFTQCFKVLYNLNFYFFFNLNSFICFMIGWLIVSFMIGVINNIFDSYLIFNLIVLTYSLLKKLQLFLLIKDKKSNF